MLSRLLPRTTSFFDFFEKHSSLIIEVVKELRSVSENPSDIQSVAGRIKEIERRADQVTHACVQALHKTFITPIDRNEIYRLITALDDVVDMVDGVARRLALYDVTEIPHPFDEAAEVLTRAAAAVDAAVHGLRNMKNAEAILDQCVRITRLEEEGDAIYAAAVANLFRKERDPILVMKWREIYEILENASDACEDVANVIESVVLENA